MPAVSDTSIVVTDAKLIVIIQLNTSKKQLHNIGRSYYTFCLKNLEPDSLVLVDHMAGSQIKYSKDLNLQ